jgi:hypothetical protein
MEMHKKQMHTEEDFLMAMSAMKSAGQPLSTFDWQHLINQTNFFEGSEGR